MTLKTHEVTYSIQEKQIIDSISFEVNKGECVGLIGPNGSGKSTLLKNVYRVLQPDAGWISLNGENVKQQTARQTALQMAVVSQDAPILFDFSVKEIVYMGRSPHKKWLEADTLQDSEIVEEALEQVGMTKHTNRSFMSLSGGEKQRVLIARALAQQARYLILDEPTNHLDIHHQLQMMDLVKTLDVTVLAALHDLNIAATYCDRIIMLQSGKIVADGTPEQVLTKERLRSVYGVETDITIHPLTQKTHITFLSDVFLKTHQEVSSS